jgi:hypothetical protein
VEVARRAAQRITSGRREWKEFDAEQTGASASFIGMDATDAEPLATPVAVDVDVDETDGADGELLP